jgi:predicted phosphoadenosine phosphosulfate sulfurtransferase
MTQLKKYTEQDVLSAARERIVYVFDHFPRIYLSFSAGKDSTVMLHLVMAEAQRRRRKIGVLLVDLEAQYRMTMELAAKCFEMYADNIEKYWVQLPIALRNAVSNFQPQWLCWDPAQEANWVRPHTEGAISDSSYFDFFQDGMEFEEFVPLFGEWYARSGVEDGPEELTACFVGIRTDESLNRFRTISERDKVRHGGRSWTTQVTDNVYNVYPIYDWGVGDIWHYHFLNPELPYNRIYDYMHKAGMSPSQMRICQPYGDDQRKGLWLYHILEPKTWYRVVARVNGANSGALYVQERGNAMGYGKISKPEGHTWKSFCNLLLATLPEVTRNHYIKKFRVFLKWWKARGYPQGIPDEAPRVLETERMAPSWRRLCKVLLRNDYWCKGLAFTQPKSAAYERYLQMKKSKTLLQAPIDKKIEAALDGHKKKTHFFNEYVEDDEDENENAS